VAAENVSQSNLVYSVGYADGADGIVSGLSSGQIEIMPTLAGDATLSGTVSFGDFQLFSQYFGSSGGWDEGNFTYGSAIDFGDFQLLSQNFGQIFALAAGTQAEDSGSGVVRGAASSNSVEFSQPTGLIFSEIWPDNWIFDDRSGLLDSRAMPLL
jgi:hypothetical protein